MIGFSAQISVVSPLEPAKLVSSARKPSPCVFSELLRVVFAEIFFFPPSLSIDSGVPQSFLTLDL